MNIKELYSLYKENPKISTDSRKIYKNSIFFSLKGEKFDGNNFVDEALKKGASYAIIDNPIHQKKGTILVKDCLATLQELAKHHRLSLNIPIIGITGTNGKTTSKELIKTSLQSKFNIYATKGNLNNHIGVPLSILEIKEKTDIAIIEMGANHKNEIAFLCEIAKPNYGIITNIGKAHLEGFGGFKGVVKAKNELYKYIEKNKGYVFINSEDNLLVSLAKNIQKIEYGYNNILFKNNEDIFTKIKYNNINIKSNLIGDYQMYNILLAIRVAEYFNVPIKDVKYAIENYIPKDNRSEIVKTKKNTLILDAYNANPSSMNAMLHSFAKQEGKNKLCIIGDMLELGEFAIKEHEKIIQLNKELNLESIYIGTIFSKICKNGFKNREEFVEYILQKPIEGKKIMLKGSRSMELEKLINFL
tara:strand:- start:1028 stop:2275 length:1248 start_codon:yes stop_codon:yes gene_type:complete